MEYFMGCFLMQGLLYGFGFYVISKEQLYRDSLVGESTGFMLRHCLCGWNMERVERSM